MNSSIACHNLITSARRLSIAASRPWADPPPSHQLDVSAPQRERYQTWNSYAAGAGSVRIQADAVGAANARELFRSIEDASSNMRNTLTERYKRPFQS